MKLLKDYFELQKQIHEYFGYVEDWASIPIDDATDYFWYLNSEGVRFSECVEKLMSDGDYYFNQIYTQRFLPKYIYEGKDYTMICVDTRTDGNKFLQIFDNSKRINIHEQNKEG